MEQRLQNESQLLKCHIHIYTYHIIFWHDEMSQMRVHFNVIISSARNHTGRVENIKMKKKSPSVTIKRLFSSLQRY